MPELLQAQIDATIEPNVRQEVMEYGDGGVGIGLMYWMAQAGQIIAPWWSKTRDKQLRRFWKDADHVASAFWMMSTKMISVPFSVQPRDSTIKTHHTHAEYYNALLQEEVAFGGGWSEFWMPFYLDLWSQDNGAFAEVLGKGRPDGPIEGPVIGLRHLDSYRCSRTSSPEFPVVYLATDGKKYKLHHTRVMYISQMRAPAEEMYGVGHCWLTRAINLAQTLVDISIYKQEKLGSRPPRQLLIGRGISTKELQMALRMANEDMDNQGLTRFSKTALIGSKNPEIGVDRIDLASVPDGFDERTAVELGMYLIALAGGFPPRWLWPASSTGATKADAMYQHIAGTGGGASWHIQMMTRLLAGSPRGASHSRGKVLPPYLKIVFDYQDDEQDANAAAIAKTRADVRERNLNAGSTNQRVNREEMLEDGELTEAQFEALELDDGRLPDGQDVLTLFVIDDPAYQELLDLDVEEPLLTIANDPEEMLVAIELAAIEAMYVATNTTNKVLATKANYAMAALAKLKAAYEPLVAQATQEDMEADTAAAGQEVPNAEGEQEAPLAGTDGEQEEGPKPPAQDQAPDEGAKSDVEDVDEEEKDLILEAVYLMKEMEPALSLQDHYEVLDKAFDFGAKMGQVISGALARGAGGRFVNAAQLQAQRDQIRGRIAARLRGAMMRRRGRRGLRGEQTPRAKVQDERRERLASFIQALRESRAAPPKGGGAKKKPEKPKTEKKPTGGRAKKPTVSPEERERKKRVEQAQKREEVFNQLTDSLDVEKGDLDALHAYLSAGKEGDTSGNVIEEAPPSPEVEARLVSQGLLQYDQDGNLQSTGAARSLLAAARTDNIQRAREAVQRGRRLREAKVQRVEDMRQRAEKESKEQADMEQEAKDYEADFEQDAKRLDEDKAGLEERLTSLKKDPVANRDLIRDTEDKIRATEDKKRERQDRLQDRLDRIRERMDKSKANAEKLKADADRIARQVGLLGGDEMSEEAKEVRLKSAANFRSAIRSNVRSLWGGNTDLFGFTYSMVNAIELHLRDAWHQGAESCGIKEDELTPDEVAARDAFVNGQTLYVMDFGVDVEAVGAIHLESPRDPAGKLGPLMSRGEMWANRWQEAFAKGKAMACANKKLRWDLGEAEHCGSCLKLAGKVKRAKYWSERGIYPRSAGATYLECRGYNCQCEFNETDEPQSKGPLPSLP